MLAVAKLLGVLTVTSVWSPALNSLHRMFDFNVRFPTTVCAKAKWNNKHMV